MEIKDDVVAGETTYLQLINHDETFATHSGQAVVVNDVDIFDPVNRKMIDQILISDHGADNISLVPSCMCGALRGQFYVGMTCSNPQCLSTVTSLISHESPAQLFARRPAGVEKFVSPAFMAMLLKRYKITKPSIPVVAWLTQTNYKIEGRQSRRNAEKLERIESLLRAKGISRGYNEFVKHFFEIIDVLEAEFIQAKVRRERKFVSFLEHNAHAIFSEYLPFPNKSLIVLETNEFGRIIDKALFAPIDALRKLSGIDLYTRPNSMKQNRVASAIIALALFSVNYMKNSIFSKNGLIRQHAASTRCHFTTRCVLTTIREPHRYDEVHLPWSAAIGLFREHLLKRLYQEGYTFRMATSYVERHKRVFSEKLYGYLNDMIEWRDGVDILLCRNPSLQRGSIQHLRIVKVKTNPQDKSMSASPLVFPSSNADVDGDELNIMLILTDLLFNAASNFDMHHSVLAEGSVDEFSSNLALPKTGIATLSNWLAKANERRPSGTSDHPG